MLGALEPREVGADFGQHLERRGDIHAVATRPLTRHAFCARKRRDQPNTSSTHFTRTGK
jgi:hypothetical protein